MVEETKYISPDKAILDLGKRKEEESSIYYIKDGKQYVKSNFREFTCYTKKRWLGKSLLSTFSTEFKLYAPSYYVCVYIYIYISIYIYIYYL